MHRVVPLFVLLVACSGAPAVTTSELVTTTTGAMTTTTTGATTTTAPPVWERLPNLPTPRSEMPAVALGGRVYVAGGFLGGVGGASPQATVEVFDPAVGGWSPVADMPEPRHHHMAASHGGYLFVFGGLEGAGFRTASATTWRYDPAADEWAVMNEMPGVVASGAAAALGHHIYVVGGQPNGLTYRYTPDEDRWDEVASLDQPRHHVGLVAHDGLLYAMGGRWEGGEFASVEVYHPESDAWSAGPEMLEVRTGFGTAVWADQIVVVGGELLVGPSQTLTSVHLFDPASGTWGPSEPLPVALHGLGLAVLGESLYAMGGSRRAGDVANSGDALVRQP